MPSSGIIGIPTGNRSLKAAMSAEAWSSAGIDVVSYYWDNETGDAIRPHCVKTWTGKRKSFAKLHNYMASQTEWDWYICGADDLYPDKVDLIDKYCKKYDGSIIWADDGLLRIKPTHPIITRQWYEKYKTIFDERFAHNYCDTDLFTWTSQRGEVVKCFDIAFDHRHPIKTKDELDTIYKIGRDSFREDNARFYDKYKDSSSYLGLVKRGHL